MLSKKKIEIKDICELDWFINKSCIDKEYHAKVFEFQEFVIAILQKSSTRYINKAIGILLE